MPKRQSVREVDSEEVQGEGAYVIVRSVPYGLIREAAEKKDRDDVAPEEEQAFTERLFEAGIKEWNWVDDDGKSLPYPGQEGWSIDALLTTEVEFLVEAILGRKKLKNSN